MHERWDSDCETVLPYLRNSMLLDAIHRSREAAITNVRSGDSNREILSRIKPLGQQVIGYKRSFEDKQLSIPHIVLLYLSLSRSVPILPPKFTGNVFLEL